MSQPNSFGHLQLRWQIEERKESGREKVRRKEGKWKGESEKKGRKVEGRK